MANTRRIIIVEYRLRSRTNYRLLSKVYRLSLLQPSADDLRRFNDPWSYAEDVLACMDCTFHAKLTAVYS